MTDTEKRLAEIEERAKAATSGPWVHDGDIEDEYDGFVSSEPENCTVMRPGINNPGRTPDADFVAHARDDVPWLCQEVRRLREALRIIAKSEPVIGSDGRQVWDPQYVANRALGTP